MAQSKAHMEASNRYNKKAYDRFSMMFKKGQKDIITAHAKSLGKSLNGYINDLIAADMGDKLTKPEKSDSD